MIFFNHVGPLLNGLPGAIFQQDNVRPQTARVTQDFLHHFQTLPWLARSPDLSPVKHLWDQLKWQMPSCHSIHDLELAVQDLWAHLPQDNIRCLINSMLDRVSSSLIASLPDSEVLNTPSITLPSELETPAILRSFSLKKSDNKVSCQAANENTTDTLPFTPDEQSDLGEVPSETVMDSDLSVENTNFPSIDQSRTSVFVTEQSSVLKTSSTRTSVVQTPVITSIGSSTPGKSNASGVPTAVVVTRPTNIVRNLAPAQIPVIAEKTNQVKAPEQPQAIVQVYIYKI
ncbi:uncharacterized protein TNCV_3869471 [Trichonephila clavipes]|nr:uncharacterized protein TNCV_3869471 [Trichonephila clavipes]